MRVLGVRKLRGIGAGAAVGLALTGLGCGSKERVFDGGRAFDHLVRQVEIGPRYPGSEGHRRALEYYVQHLEATADQVRVHRFETVSPLDSSDIVLESVIASFAPGERNSRMLFGAHWDTRPIADEEEDESRRGEPILGANDGASGVAVLLELATVLAESPPAVGVDLVLFDGEDSGVAGKPETYALGSQRFVRDQVSSGYRPAFAIILDMVGRRGTRIAKEAHSVQAAGFLVERLWELGRELELTVLADTLGLPVMDDHIPFLQAGIPAVDLIDLADPDWHTLRDLPENCAPEPLEEIGRLLLKVVDVAEERAQSP